MHYNQKHHQYEEKMLKRAQKSDDKDGKLPGVSHQDETALKKISNLCCFPAFWLVLIILGLVFGLFFVLVAKDKLNTAVDARNNSDAATQLPDNSGRLINSTVLDQGIDVLTPNKTVTLNHQNLKLRHQLAGESITARTHAGTKLNRHQLNIANRQFKSQQ